MRRTSLPPPPGVCNPVEKLLSQLRGGSGRGFDGLNSYPHSPTTRFLWTQRRLMNYNWLRGSKKGGEKEGEREEELEKEIDS